MLENYLLNQKLVGNCVGWRWFLFWIFSEQRPLMYFLIIQKPILNAFGADFFEEVLFLTS